MYKDKCARTIFKISKSKKKLVC